MLRSVLLIRGVFRKRQGNDKKKTKIENCPNPYKTAQKLADLLKTGAKKECNIALFAGYWNRTHKPRANIRSPTMACKYFALASLIASAFSTERAPAMMTNARMTSGRTKMAL